MQHHSVTVLLCITQAGSEGHRWQPMACMEDGMHGGLPAFIDGLQLCPGTCKMTLTGYFQIYGMHGQQGSQDQG
jgi:hypothetical protein